MVSFDLTDFDVARFWSSVDKTHGHGPDGSCWVWTRCLNCAGYGILRVSGKNIRAHRVSAKIAGKLDDNLHLCHTCDNPRCVNPDHLWPCTASENAADKSKKGRHPSVFRTGYLPCGDEHWSRRFPEKVHRGANHISKIKPECICRGERVSKAKLTAEIVTSCRDAFHRDKVTASELARKHGVSTTAMYNVVHNKVWRHIPQSVFAAEISSE